MSGPGQPGVVALETGVLDIGARKLTRPDGSVQTLTPTEATLIAHLAAAPGMPVPRGELLSEVWGYREGVRTRTIDTTMRRLRRKIERVPSIPRHLETVDGVGYRFVPLQALSIGGTAPAALDATVGREEALALLSRLAEGGARLLNLVGPGGIGKTRLALTWIRDHASLTVELGEVAAAEDMVEAIASAAELSATSPAALATQLQGRGVKWLLLDNLEQLLPGAGPVLTALAATDLRILTTSRRRLGVAGETTVEVPPLSPEAGVALLRARAPSHLHTADEADLISIVEQVDGMPLALELAAAHAGLLGAHGLRSRLASSLHLIHQPATGVVARGMDEVIDWSWRMLGTADRNALRALLVFRGGISIDAAEAVLDDPAPLARLQSLRDQSWLVPRHGPDGSPRLGLLVPLRAFLHERLGPDVQAAHRHAAHFAQFGSDEARRRLDMDDGRARGALAADWPNLLAAIDHCIATARWTDAARLLMAAWEGSRLSHPPTPLIDRISATLEHGADALSPGWLARVNIALADVLRGTHLTEEGIAAANRAIEAGVAEPAVVARATSLLAIVFQEHGQHEAAQDAHLRALQQATDAEAHHIVALIRSNMGNLAQRRGHLQQAREHLEVSVRLFDRLQIRRLAAVARSNLGIVWHDLGDLETAEDCYRRALREHRSLGNLRYVALIEGNLGGLAVDRQEYAAAADHLHLAHQLHLQVGNLRSAGIVQLTAAECARLMGDQAKAEACLETAMSLAERTDSALLRTVVDGLHAELSCARSPAAAVARAERAVAGLDAMDAGIEAAIARCRLGRIQLRCGHRDHAEAQLALAEVTRVKRSLELRSELGRHIVELRAALSAAGPV